MSIFFVVHNRNHVRLVAQSATVLRERGHVVHIVDLEQLGCREGALEECRRFGVESRSFNWLNRHLSAGDLVIACNDWSPGDFPMHLTEMKGRGAILIGLIDGCKWSEPYRYNLVDHILAYGRAALHTFSQPIQIVGSPVIEHSLSQRRPGLPSSPPFALINYKFTYDHCDGRERWIRSVLAACSGNNIDAVISGHPSNASDPLHWPLCSGDFTTLVRSARVVITRPSTIILEALSHGIPVVLYPVDDEFLGEFSDSRGAFDIAAQDTLEATLACAIQSEDKTWAVEEFLAEQLSIDPTLPAWARIADALEFVQAISPLGKSCQVAQRPTERPWRLLKGPLGPRA